MQLVRYSPSRDLARFERELDKLLRDSRTWSWPLPTVFQDLTTIDMYKKDGKLAIEVMLPAFKKEEIKINVSGDMLDITAEHEETEEKKADREYILHETGRNYHRQVLLPEGVQVDKAEATFVDSTLTLTMPFEPRIEAKEVPIK